MKIHDVDLPATPDEPARPAGFAGPAGRSRSRMRVIELAADEADQARCPRCGVPMVARLGRAGPYFFCRCRPREAAARQAILPLEAQILPFPPPAPPAPEVPPAAGKDAGKKDEAPLVITLGSR